MTASELVDALRTHYPASHGWLLLPQVRDGTGWQGLRTADAIVMNAWPSRGLEVHGFELKVSRADWQRELKQPAKADSIFGFCDRWWIVTPETKVPIIRAGELPPTWGHLVVDDVGRAAEATPAPKLTPQPLDRTFVASLLRSLQKCETPEARLEAARKSGYADGHKAGYELAAARMSDVQTVQWKRDSLEALERSARRVYEEIKREVATVRAMADLPAAVDEDGRRASSPLNPIGRV